MDERSQHGAWTRGILALISEDPATRAGDLFATAGYPNLLSFKRDVRRLKN